MKEMNVCRWVHFVTQCLEDKEIFYSFNHYIILTCVSTHIADLLVKKSSAQCIRSGTAYLVIRPWIVQQRPASST